MKNVELSAATSCTIEWSWDAATKTWLVQAFRVRDGSRSLVAQCHVLRSDPLPDHQLVQLLHSIVDYWQAGFLF